MALQQGCHYVFICYQLRLNIKHLNINEEPPKIADEEI